MKTLYYSCLNHFQQYRKTNVMLFWLKVFIKLSLSHNPLRSSFNFFFFGGERSSHGNSVGVDWIDIDLMQVPLMNRSLQSTEASHEYYTMSIMTLHHWNQNEYNYYNHNYEINTLKFGALYQFITNCIFIGYQYIWMQWIYAVVGTAWYLLYAHYFDVLHSTAIAISWL